MKLRSLLLAVLFGVSPVCSASLIQNGSFEDNRVGNGQWAWFQSAAVPNWSGSNIEIWHNFQKLPAYEGVQFIELNAHGQNQGAWSIFQSFDTQIGQQYQLSFAYRARTGNQERFNVTVGDFSQLFSDHTRQAWSVFSGSFTATSTTSVLRFTSLNSGTYGNFIDDVQVNAVSTLVPTAVPAPASFGLLGLAVAGLIGSRRQRPSSQA